MTAPLFSVLNACCFLVANLMHKRNQNPDMASILDTVLEQEHFEVIYKQRTDIPLGTASD